MIGLNQRIVGLARLGCVIEDCLVHPDAGSNTTGDFLRKALIASTSDNPWFTSRFTEEALRGLALMLQTETLQKWATDNKLPSQTINPRTVGLIMAGNIPAVGFHDLLSVLISGHHALVKLSSSDKHLIPALVNELIAIEPGFADAVHFADQQLKDFDAVIATGSDNTARYFEYYFADYPHIIRKNRNSTAVLDGTETQSELSLLADDIFMYFGFGCRNVSKLFLPDGYDLRSLFPSFSKYGYLKDHSKYFNNYEYNKAIMLINNEVHYDNGFALMKPSPHLASPVSVLHYEFYSSPNELVKIMDHLSNQIQVVVSKHNLVKDSVSFGRSQFPNVDDYADKINTLDFLRRL